MDEWKDEQSLKASKSMWFFQILCDFQISKEKSVMFQHFLCPDFFFLSLFLLLFQRRIATSLLLTRKLLAAAIVVSAVLTSVSSFSSFDLNQFGSSTTNYSCFLFISNELDGNSREAAVNQFVTNEIDTIII